MIACKEQAERKTDMRYYSQLSRGIIIAAALVVTILPSKAGADDIQLTVATDKYTYLVGEDITISVTAFNPGSESVTLTFPTSLQASYIMDDGAYYWGGDVIIALSEIMDLDYDAYFHRGAWGGGVIALSEIMDLDYDAYYWGGGGIWGVIDSSEITEVTLAPESSHTWELELDWGPEYGYGIPGIRTRDYVDPRVGTHSVMGILQTMTFGAVTSEPAQFEVVPEPATMSLLAIGCVAMLSKRWRT